MEIKFTENKLKNEMPEADKLGFGKYFTDHMFIMDYDGTKWTDRRIVPFGRFEIHPASTVLHYAAEIFEGMKAYRTPSGEIQLFRPLENARRFNSSSDRLCMPPIDEDEFVEILKRFVKIEEKWVPTASGASLYLRPFMFGNDETLGVHPVHHARFMVIASPVGSYYKEGINPIKIMIEDNDVRTAPSFGGTGYTKCGGNYAASTRAAAKAIKAGYAQVLWLDSAERKYIEEVGAMNVMFLIGDEIITPELTGSVLPGITRKSCIELLTNKGYKVVERKLERAELISAAKNGQLKEAWGTGTAAVVSPIGTLADGSNTYLINNGKIGKVAQDLYDTLTGIQWGKFEDPYGWTIKI